jgi:hypothetical protein
MNALPIRSLALAALLAATQTFGQEATRPVGLPSDPNIIAFALRAEGAMRSALPDVTPVVEGYFQQFVPTEKPGYAALHGDRYVLGRFYWSDGPRVLDLRGDLLEDEGGAAKPVDGRPLLDGLLQLMVPDWEQLDPERYEYTFVGVVFLGAVRCVVYDVRPLNSAGNGFAGRVYLEDKTWNIARFIGTNPRVDALFAALRGKHSRFHVDSWRVNVCNNRWFPAYAYVEEVAPLGAAEQPIVKGQIRYWGYDRTGAQAQQKFVDVRIDESPSAAEGRQQQWPSPQQSQRLFEHQAEGNVLARLTQARLLGVPGEVEKMLDQVVTNLVITNKLALAERVRCRVLLTTPIEAFMVGNTCILSRGLIDVLPNEAALALVLAHQLAHNVLGHRKIDTRLAFPDVLRISDAELEAKLRFQHTPAEEAAADAKALDLLEQSPYKPLMADGGLFMQALQARAGQLVALIHPTFGEHIADRRQQVRNHEMFRTAPLLDETLATQMAALPLGAKLVVNPWNGRIELFRSEPLAALAPYERAELAVTPFMPLLDYAEKPAVPKPSNAATRPAVRPRYPAVNSGAQAPAAGVKHSVGEASKGHTGDLAKAQK